MPFVSNMNEDEEKKQTPGAQGGVSPEGSGNGAIRLAPDAGVEAGGGSTKGPVAAGGQFASLNQYLKANVGQAEPLAGKLTSEIGKQYQGLESSGQQALSKIGGQVSAAPSYENASKTISEATANPISFTSDPNRTASFQNLLKAAYTGPLSAEGTAEYTGQQEAINRAIAQGQNTVKTEAGRSNLIKDVSAKPTTGVTALNSAILSKSPTALASVESAYKPFQNLLTNLQTGAAETNKTIAKKQEEAAGAKKASTEALTSGMSTFNTGVQGKVTAAQKSLADQNARIKNELAAGTPSDATLQAVGMSRDQWNALSAAQKAAATPQDVFSNQRQFGATSGTSNIDLTGFLGQQDPNALLSAENVATPEDYAKAQAFRSLLGNLNLQTPELAINPNAAGKAGTAPKGASTFDYETALGTAKQAKADQLAAAQAYVDALQAGADERHAQLAAEDAAKRSAVSGGVTALAGIGPAAMTGYGTGAYDSLKGAISKPSLKSAADLANSLVGPKGIANAGKGIAKGATDAVKTVTNIFCFHPDTLITMDNGSLLPIHKIVVGDITKGGKVLATTRAVGQDFYWYNGIIVTGKHAVKEGGTWIRVENSKLGHKFNYLTEVVCNLVTEKHRIFAHGIEFADQYETDLYESLDMDESLRELNRNA